MTTPTTTNLILAAIANCNSSSDMVIHVKVHDTLCDALELLDADIYNEFIKCSDLPDEAFYLSELSND